MVAALGYLEIRVVARRQFHALRRHQIQKRLVLRRQVFMNRGHHLFIALRAGDLQHPGMLVEDFLRLRPQAARDDHPAVLGQRLADRIERLVHRRIDEAAGVHHHEIRRAVACRHLIAFGAQARENALGVDERLGAAQADKAHFGSLADYCFQDEFKPWGTCCAPQISSLADCVDRTAADCTPIRPLAVDTPWGALNRAYLRPERA